MKRSGPPARKKPMRRTGIQAGDPAAWQRRSRDAARARPGRAEGSTLPAVGRRGAADAVAAEVARLLVWARDGGACRWPHHLPVMDGVVCSAPHPDGPPLTPDGRWRRDPRNRGYLALCHVIPKELAGSLRWSPDNLFVGCDAGNGWAEDHTGEAFETGRHGHQWDRVADGKVVT